MSALQPMQQHTVFWRMPSKTHGLFQILSHARICSTRSSVFKRVFINDILEMAPRKKYRRRFRYEQHVADHMYPISNFPHLLLTSCNFWKFFKTAQSHPVYSPCRSVYIYIYIYIYIYKGMLTYTNGVISEIPWIAKTCWLPTTFSYICYTLHSLCNALD